VSSEPRAAVASPDAFDLVVIGYGPPLGQRGRIGAREGLAFGDHASCSVPVMSDGYPHPGASAGSARRTWRALEAFHGMIYFSPEAAASYEAAGLAGGLAISRPAPPRWARSRPRW
jgi:hypothetical protein